MREAGGFSLVELMVALVIFAFGVLAGVALLGSGYRWEGQAELETQMTVAAEMKVEELKAVAGTELADTVQLMPGGDLDSNMSGYWDTAELDGRVFTRRWRVQAGPAGTRQVTVRVLPLDPPAAGYADLWTHVLHD
ncbi:MAG: type II secretion system protein [Gemmatimonadota bacterium]|nr:MAG: type II secretion system protein [Gemmatimonadota bacterium]